MAVFWLVAIVVIVWLVRSVIPMYNESQRGRSGLETPHEALQRRLANGEITKDEYRELKSELDKR